LTLPVEGVAALSVGTAPVSPGSYELDLFAGNACETESAPIPTTVTVTAP